MSRIAWEAHQRLDALLEMLSDESGGGPGSVDTDHLNALREAPPGHSKRIAEAHREGRGPPETPEDRGGGSDD